MSPLLPFFNHWKWHYLLHTGSSSWSYTLLHIINSFTLIFTEFITSPYYILFSSEFPHVSLERGLAQTEFYVNHKRCTCAAPKFGDISKPSCVLVLVVSPSLVKFYEQQGIVPLNFTLFQWQNNTRFPLRLITSSQFLKLNWNWRPKQSYVLHNIDSFVWYILTWNNFSLHTSWLFNIK